MPRDLTDLLLMEKQGRHQEALGWVRKLQANRVGNSPARNLNLDLLTRRLHLKLARSHAPQDEGEHGQTLATSDPVSSVDAQSATYISLAEEQERRGHLARAVDILGAAARDPAQTNHRPALTKSVERILCECVSRAMRRTLSIDTVHENARNPGSVCTDAGSPEPAPIISLTAISSRIDRVARTVDSIANQSLRPHSINLYISEDPYLLDKGIARDDANVRRIIDAGVNVYVTPNIGPYRKQYPLIQQLKKRGAALETLIVTIDDDVLYPPHVLEKLVEAARYADAVIAYRGRQMAYDKVTVASYRKFEVPQSATSHLNLATGKNGIAYRLKHFPTDPCEYIGPELAPTADDIWCKWVTGIRCIPTMIIDPGSAYDAKFDFPESAPTDKNGLFHAFNKNGTNDESMRNMEAFFMYKRGVNLGSLYGGGA